MQYLFIHALLIAINLMLKEIGNCDIDFFNFCHRQVQNLGILNQSERDQNFAVNFQKHRKQK